MENSQFSKTEIYEEENWEENVDDELLDEEEFRRIYTRIQKRRKKHYFLRILVFLGIVLLTYLIMASSYFNIKEIKVEGNNYYTPKEVVNMANAKTGVNLFFHPGKKNIIENLEKNPYFKDVKVKRTPPHTLKIIVEERHQMAALVYGKEYVVIDEEGRVLRKAKVLPKVTVLTGLKIKKMELGEPVEVEDKEGLETTLKMLKEMEKGKFYFKKVSFSKVLIRAYIYDTLVVKGTPSQIMEALKRGDLQKVVNNLFKDQITRGTINCGGDDYLSFSPEIN